MFTCVACHKPEQTQTSTTTTSTTNTTTSDTTYADSITTSPECFYAGNIIMFGMTQTKPGSYIVAKDPVWDFGDGTAPAHDVWLPHTFNSAGTYTVSLTVNGNLFKRVVNIGDYPIRSVHTAAMAGSRLWKGTAHGYLIEFPGSEEIRTIEMPMVLEVVNNGVIKLPLFWRGLTLDLYSEDTVLETLTFKDCTYSNIELKYYYAIDSMVYTDYFNNGHKQGGVVIHTP